MVESVRRALLLLETLNSFGTTSVHQLHEVSKLPKSTIVRLLATLCKEGYVAKSRLQHGYQLTSRVRSLSSGYEVGNVVIDAAQPLAIEFTQTHSWPVAIATLDNGVMISRFSTTPQSPMSPHDGRINMRLNLLTRALGRAYLAACNDDERALILRMLRQSSHPEDKGAHNVGSVNAMLNQVRKVGFAIRPAYVEPKFSSTIAAPILLNGRVVASVGMTYFRSAIPKAKATSHYGPLVVRLSKTIGERAAALDAKSA